MIFTKKITALLFVFILFVVALQASEHTVTFTGNVTSLEQEPVPFFPVYIIHGNDSLDAVETFTDENGIYMQDIKVESGEVYSVSVFDCQNNQQSKAFENPDSVNIADFSICTYSGGCQAIFQEEQDSSNPMAYFFYNYSEGDYNVVEWDFGDGTVSHEENPYHVFPQQGVYTVSLSIFDTLTPSGCFDMFQQDIVTGEPFGCLADFTVTLDTLNNTPFVYHFINNSSGDSLLYFWDFGDGDFSQEQSPWHTYTQGGTYIVNLFIQNIYGFCFDEIDKTVVTAQYHNFGGQVFLGNYPINNDPADSSNIATAYLFRKMEGRWHYVDERNFWQLGYYWFTNKLEGDYLIKVSLKSGSADYNNYAPGYIGKTVKWQSATTFTLNEDVFEESVYMVKLAPLDLGINKISGYTFFDSTLKNTVIDTLTNVLVQLFNQTGNIVGYTYSNNNGKYEFDNLPNGNYKVRGEVIGSCSSQTPVTLSDETPENSDVDIAIFDCGNIGISENSGSVNLISATLYPVPANKTLTLNLYSQIIDKVIVNIYNIQGKKMENNTITLSETGTFKIDVSNKPAGIYLLNILNTNHRRLLSKKFIVSH